MKPENKDRLTAILTYHVVAGKVIAADVVKLEEAKTVNGKMLKVKVEGSNVMINDAKVTATDTEAANGVSYTGISPLRNPPNDADLMAQTLRHLGFSDPSATPGRTRRSQTAG